MWKPASLGNPPASAVPRHPPLARGALVYAPSLFTKKPSPFHIGWYFEEVPTVNPSVKNQRFLPAPFGKGASGVPPVSISHGSFLRIVLSLTRPVSLLRCSRCIGQSPPCQRGVPRHRRGGGIPQAGKFPHRLVLLESACCESLSHGCAVPAPFSKGAFGCAIDTGRGREVTNRRKLPCALSAATRRSSRPSGGMGGWICEKRRKSPGFWGFSSFYSGLYCFISL